MYIFFSSIRNFGSLNSKYVLFVATWCMYFFNKKKKIRDFQRGFNVQSSGTNICILLFDS